MSDLLTPQQFCDELEKIGEKRSKATILNWIKDGKIKATNNKLKINKRAVYMIERSQLDKFKS